MSIKDWLKDRVEKFMGEAAMQHIIEEYITEENADRVIAEKEKLERHAAEEVLDYAEDFATRKDLESVLRAIAKLRAVFNLPEIPDEEPS
jgi:hypothetical protein